MYFMSSATELVAAYLSLSHHIIIALNLRFLINTFETLFGN